MKKKHGELKAIAEWLGTTPSVLCNYFAGRSRPGIKKAKQLERKSGISWIWWVSMAPRQLEQVVIKQWREHESS